MSNYDESPDYGTSLYVNSRGHNSEYGYWRGVTYDREGLQKLKWILEQYDEGLTELAQEGGNVTLIHMVNRLLTREFTISGPYGREIVQLGQPDALRSALSKIGQTDVRFNVRRLPFGLPTYYFARTYNDWWELFSLIVEDIHISKSYPLLDNRFARLMVHGHEKYYLRLSLFREGIERTMDCGNNNSEEEIDALLYALGRSVFQGAWHTDQRFVFVFAEAFGLEPLRNALELLYMCLSCDLAAVRRFLTPSMHSFFRTTYSNPAIGKLLESIEWLPGSKLSALNKEALTAYQQLTANMNRVLAREIPWRGSWQKSIPLWKLVVANVGRLGCVASQLRDTELIDGIRGDLKQSAVMAIDHIMKVAV